MKIQELMERVGILETGRTIAYVKDALIEMNMIAETHITTQRSNITQNQRYYDFPNNMVKITDIRVKNHLNSKDEYRSIPRIMYEPKIEDADQELT
jgi:hypothetical protein